MNWVQGKWCITKIPLGNKIYSKRKGREGEGEGDISVGIQQSREWGTSYGGWELRKDSNDEKKIMVILVAAEAIVPFDFIKTNKNIYKTKQNTKEMKTFFGL